VERGVDLLHGLEVDALVDNHGDGEREGIDGPEVDVLPDTVLVDAEVARVQAGVEMILGVLDGDGNLHVVDVHDDGGRSSGRRRRRRALVLSSVFGSLEGGDGQLVAGVDAAVLLDELILRGLIGLGIVGRWLCLRGRAGRERRANGGYGVERGQGLRTRGVRNSLLRLLLLGHEGVCRQAEA
jgi:hypothetical protein